MYLSHFCTRSSLCPNVLTPVRQVVTWARKTQIQTYMRVMRETGAKMGTNPCTADTMTSASNGAYGRMLGMASRRSAGGLGLGQGRPWPWKKNQISLNSGIKFHYQISLNLVKFAVLRSDMNTVVSFPVQGKNLFSLFWERFLCVPHPVGKLP